ncbi:precorrin-4 C(11)-methyltransferase [Diplocloster agilis]|uniref:Precorrin-4 C(11)-methyltransferase n=1 Tax=Diplocloster agilis TaxID=2850323 RepID=A0A949NAH5_9FIRM|nr:precorrin-4 C(11)-methyltransferase [Diplocloster agilis]MBU9736487.1 precorrin-4 C(11)-methyltransferase [Diplocloster agilis]MBU9744339.1 precorrin-4 C(11)-methyltransferase [Diplocloster agilis]
MINFVGAGPGAKDLITVRGLELLRTADIIIYAGSLVNPELLQEAAVGCRIYNSAYMTLDEVVKVMIDGERSGYKVVRLHTGDPSLYGAIREQMDRLEEAGIGYQVCPGVSSFCAAAAALQAEYTLPAVSQSVIITRMEGRTPVPEKEKLHLLAGHGCTMVIFLSVGMVEKVRQELLDGAYSEETPCAIVYKASWKEEQIVRGKLKELPQMALNHGIRKTALIVVGECLGDDYELSKLYDASFTTEFRKGTKV